LQAHGTIFKRKRKRMLIIPLQQRLHWGNFPWVTLAFIAIHCAVFLSFEPADSERWAPHTDRFDLLTLFTSTFVHADWQHLLGNVLLLAVLGLLLEGALGGSAFFGLYLLTGMGAAICSFYLTGTTPARALGASAAIAGLMGAYGVVYGMRPVRVFYWFFVVMDYVRVPAGLLFIPWIAFSGMRLHSAELGVALSTHIAGFALGGLLAWLMKLSQLERRGFIDGSSDNLAPEQQLVAAVGHLEHNELAKAAAILAPLADKHAQDLPIQRALYRLRRLMSPHAPPHDLAHHLLLDLSWRHDQSADLEALFDDYLKAAKGRPKLTPEELSTLAHKLLAYNRLDSAQRIARVFLSDPSTLESGLQLLLKVAEQRIYRDETAQAFALLREITQLAAKDSPLQARAKALVRGASGI